MGVAFICEQSQCPVVRGDRGLSLADPPRQDHPGAVGYFHHQGCCQLPPDLDRVTETLISLGKSPNVAAVLVVSLGRGAPQGFPTMPVLKVCGNPNTYERMSHDMDINAGRIITGEKSIEEVGEEAFSAILDLLSGKQTKNETLGYHSSIDIYTLGPVI